MIERDAFHGVRERSFLESDDSADADGEFAAAAGAFIDLVAAREAVQDAPQMQVAAVFEDGEQVAPGVPEMDVDGKVPLRSEFQLDAEGFLLEGTVLVAFVVIEADFADGDDAPFPVGEHLVDLLLPVRAHRAGIQAHHRVQDAGITVVDGPEGVPLAAVHVGLDHLAHPGRQGARHGGVGVRQEPFVVEMGMGVDEHRSVLVRPQI